MDPRDGEHTFQHDVVPLSFRYNPNGLRPLKDVGPDTEIFSGQNFPDVYMGQKKDELAGLLAPIGPFAKWRITVLEDKNNGVVMKDVTDVCLEFWGRH